MHNNKVMQIRWKKRHDKKECIAWFEITDLVPKLDSWLIKQKGQKFFPKWLGLYESQEKSNNDTYKLATLDGDLIDKHINIKKLKLYRACLSQ